MKWFGRMCTVAVTVVMLLVMTTSCAVTPSGEDASYAFYVKDGQLVMMDTDTKTVYPLTQHLNAERNGRAAGMVRLDENGTRLFYLDCDTDEEGAGEYLYMRDLTKLKADAVRIDSTAGIFDVSKDGKTLAYLKKDSESGYSLYRYDGKSSTLVVEGLTGFGFTKNEDRLYYTLGEDGMNYSTGEEEEKTYYLASDTASALTAEEFETQTGGARPYTYAFEGISLSAYDVWCDGEAVDRYENYDSDEGKIWTDAGYESYFTDRLLYFTYTEGKEKYNIKQYIRGGKAEVIDQVKTGVFPAVAYTSDALPLYLQNFDKEAQTGQLMLYKDGKSILLEEHASRPVQLDYVVNLTYSLQKHMSWNK